MIRSFTLFYHFNQSLSRAAISLKQPVAWQKHVHTTAGYGSDNLFSSLSDALAKLQQQI